MGAANIILVHNHPSGNPRPSEDDYRITERVQECADVLGINLQDHVIIGFNRFASALRPRNYNMKIKKEK